MARTCWLSWSATPTGRYASCFYEPEYHADGTVATIHRTRS